MMSLNDTVSAGSASTAGGDRLSFLATADVPVFAELSALHVPGASYDGGPQNLVVEFTSLPADASDWIPGTVIASSPQDQIPPTITGYVAGGAIDEPKPMIMGALQSS